MTIADGFNFGIGLLMALASSVLCAVVMFYGSAFVIALYRHMKKQPRERG